MQRQLSDDDDDVFHSGFKIDFMRQIIYCIIHIFLFPYFCCSIISVSKKLDIEIIQTLPYLYKWQKFGKIYERKSQEYQSVGVEYIAEEINSLIL